MKKLKKYVFLMLLIAVSCFLYFDGFTYAKYVSTSVWDYYLKTKGFYISSDYLGATVVKNVDNLWNGESVHFNLKNSLNQEAIADYDIGYKAVCTITGDASSHVGCYMNGTDSNETNGVLPVSQVCNNNKNDNVDVSTFNKTDCEAGGYEWISQVSMKDLYFDVVVTDYNYVLSDVTVNIAVTSTSPYRKVLSGDFILHKNNMKEDNITLSYNNYSNYDRLVVSNSYSSNKCVKVTWNADKLMIKEDSSAFSSYVSDQNDYINEIKFNVGAKDSVSYMFYSRDFDIKYDVTEFTFEETSGC